ncbi:hypothetical protein F4803DRAFT_321566 [Xylaria telfairii]|nr:hypothetical protein F4803DRAFT_321566 [Xylaria telfairii]
MHTSSLVVLAASALSAVALDTTTSTMYLTQTVTITQCNPTNTDCPLYTPPATTSSSIFTPSSYPVLTTPSPSPSSSSSSSSFSYAANTTTTSVYYPIANSTAHGGSTGYPTVSVSSTYPGLTTTPETPTSASSSPSTTPTTGAANSLAAQSGLLVAVMGIGAILLA